MNQIRGTLKKNFYESLCSRRIKRINFEEHIKVINDDENFDSENNNFKSQNSRHFFLKKSRNFSFEMKKKKLKDSRKDILTLFNADNIRNTKNNFNEESPIQENNQDLKLNNKRALKLIKNINRSKLKSIIKLRICKKLVDSNLQNSIN